MADREVAGDGERAARRDGAWISRSAEETERAGSRLAAALRTGDVLALSGPLGAGKTRLVEGLARGLECRAAVRSPSFTLVNEYRGRLTLVHVDLYRLDPSEVDALGLDEYLERGILAVEWGEKLPHGLRRDALELRFEIRSERERAIDARRDSPRGGRASELEAAWRAATRGASGSTA